MCVAVVTRQSLVNCKLTHLPFTSFMNCTLTHTDSPMHSPTTTTYLHPQGWSIVGSDAEEVEPEGRSSMFSSTVVLANTCIGAGVLSIPFSIAVMGAALGMSVLLCISLLRLVRVCRMCACVVMDARGRTAHTFALAGERCDRTFTHRCPCRQRCTFHILTHVPAVCSRSTCLDTCVW